MYFRIELPDNVSKIIDKVVKNNLECYVVGGCVRDSLLGIKPKDWDLTTNATTAQLMDIFKNYEIIPTGLKHGTLTIVIDKEPYEITTYRVDGTYSDSRRPDSVEFVTSLSLDLARRDFTINAMAYNAKDGLIDLYGGKEDIDEGVIRCVGDATARFDEDALRLLRCLRFAVKYGFSIEDGTFKAYKKSLYKISNVAGERIGKEFKEILKYIKRDNSVAFELLVDELIPELDVCKGFNQNNKHHMYDVYRHIMESLYTCEGNKELVKFALVLHDIGKPCSYVEDENKQGHFYGHELRSAEIAGPILDRFKLSTLEKETILKLISLHDMWLADTTKSVKKGLKALGDVPFIDFLDMQLADIATHSSYSKNKHADKNMKIREIYNTIKLDDLCLKVTDLSITGKEIMSMLGVGPCKLVGEVLTTLLTKVIDEELENTNEALVAYVAAMV